MAGGGSVVCFGCDKDCDSKHEISFFLVSCTDDKGISMRFLLYSEPLKSVQERASPKKTQWSVPGEELCFFPLQGSTEYS